MGILRRLGTIFGFLKDEPHGGGGGGGGEEDDDRTAHPLPRRTARGFSVQVPVAAADADKPSVGPILVPCNLGEGGVQRIVMLGNTNVFQVFKHLSAADRGMEPNISVFLVKERCASCILHSHGDVQSFDFMRSCSACSLSAAVLCHHMGFRWYGRRLRIDEDGDVADEFLDEVLPLDRSGSQEHTTLPRFEVKYNTRPAPVRKQAIAINGNVHPSMEYKGMLRWV